MAVEVGGRDLTLTHISVCLAGLACGSLRSWRRTGGWCPQHLCRALGEHQGSRFLWRNKKGLAWVLCISSVGLGRDSVPVATGWREKEQPGQCKAQGVCDWDLGLVPHLL